MEPGVGTVPKGSVGTCGIPCGKFWDPRQEPGLEILKFGIRDWDRDPDLWDAEFRDLTIQDCPVE